MLVRELLANLDGTARCPSGDRLEIRLQNRACENVRICDITEDSRTVMPGSLFVARRGEKADGRAYIPQAIEAGAAAILTDDPQFELAAAGGRGSVRAARGKGGRSEHSEAAAAGTAAGVAVIWTNNIALASAALGERFFGQPSSRLTLIGVTGTNGKTTTTFLIHQILNRLGIRTGLIGTVMIDDGTETAKAELTTPPALEVSRTLARMVEAGCAAAVMEVSSHALDQERVGGLRFAAGIFTNLTHDHLDYHETMERYADAKAKLFEKLPDDGRGVAIVNVHDPSHTRMVRDARCRIVRCAVEKALGTHAARSGKSPETIRVARIVKASTSHTDVEMTGPWGVRRMRLLLVGEFNVMNALEAAVGVYEVFGEGSSQGGLSFDRIAGALERASPPPGRLEPVTKPGDGLSVFVDYAHTDDALRTALTTIRGTMRGEGKGEQGRKLVCVFGCGGDRDKTKRPKMGRVAAELADVVYITSDNPRTENPDAIIGQILEGIDEVHRAKVVVIADRRSAIASAIRKASAGDSHSIEKTKGTEAVREGDVVLIAGKGHENEQILPDPTQPGKTLSTPFDDRLAAGEALRARGIEPRRPMMIGGIGGEMWNDGSLSEENEQEEFGFSETETMLKGWPEATDSGDVEEEPA